MKLEKKVGNDKKSGQEQIDRLYRAMEIFGMNYQLGVNQSKNFELEVEESEGVILIKSASNTRLLNVIKISEECNGKLICKNNEYAEIQIDDIKYRVMFNNCPENKYKQ